jgi:hypothetical protein
MSGDLPGFVEERFKKVGLVVALHALKNRGKPLEPHPRVDGGLGKRVTLSVGRLVELHEHEVPDLEKSLARGIRPGPKRLFVDDHVDLGARAAGTRVSHLPEVLLLIEPEDPVLWHSDVIAPDSVGIFVFPEDRNDHRRLGDPDHACEVVPAVLDGPLLEIVPEREVPEHLEERVVAGSPANVLEVVVLPRDSHALL